MNKVDKVGKNTVLQEVELCQSSGIYNLNVQILLEKKYKVRIKRDIPTLSEI